MTVLSYPRVPPEEMVDQYVEAGSDIEFVCNAKHASQVEFYLNGYPLKSGQLSPQVVNLLWRNTTINP